MDISEDFGSVPVRSHGNGSDVIAAPAHFSDQSHFIIPTLALYATFSIVGTIANLVVIITIILNKSLHNVTNVFIAQLAVGDLLILVFCMPFTVTAAYYFKNWVYGKVMCFVVKFAGCAGPTVTVLTPAVMSYERFLCILRPFEVSDMWPQSRLILVSSFIYIISFMRSILRPILGDVYHVTSDNSSDHVTAKCSETPGTTFIFWYHLSGVVLFYGTILLMIGILYCKIGQHLRSPACKALTKNNPEVMAKRKHVVRMLVTMVVAFAIGWLPINTVILMFLTEDLKTFGKESWFVIYVFIARILEYSNCVINPLIYSFLSSNFRSAARATWSQCLPCISAPEKDRRMSLYNSSIRSKSTTVSTLQPSATSA